MREPLPLADAEIPSTLGPEAELERRAAVEELRVAIAALPEKQREAVVLRDLYGLRYDEVGAALGTSVASVESLLFRARRRLRVTLKPLVGGGLAVPVAVREGIAQAIPAFGSAGAAGVGVGGGAVSVGLLAKLAGGPAAAKVAAGVAAVAVAGSVAVAKIEHVPRPVPVGEHAGRVEAEMRAPAGMTVAERVASRPLDKGKEGTRAHRSGRPRSKDDHRAPEPVVVSAPAPILAPTPGRQAQPSGSTHADEEGSTAPHHDGLAPEQPTAPPVRQGEPRVDGSDNSGPDAGSGPSVARDADDGVPGAETAHEGPGPGSGPDGGSTGPSGEGHGGDDLLAVDAPSSEEASSGPGDGDSGSALHGDGGGSSGPGSSPMEALRDPVEEAETGSDSHDGGGGSGSGPGSASTS